MSGASINKATSPYRLMWLSVMVGPALLLLMAIHEIYSGLAISQEYPFGWEGGGWKYRTQENYIAVNIWTMTITALCIVGSIFGKSALILWPARALSTTATVPTITIFAITGLDLLGIPTDQTRAAIEADIWIPIALFPFVGSIPG